jgi:hypothetical protein
MRKGLLAAAVLGTLCFLATPARAVLQLTLENPTDGQDVSGIVAISGFAFSTVANTNVSVSLTIDGNITVAVPCCGPRQDVQQQNPGAPLNSSFSLLFNYGILSAGPHTFRVDVTAPGETAASRQVSVNIAKPGDAQFLSNFDLTGATIAADANELVIVGAQVTPQGGGATKTNLRAAYVTSLQSLTITEAFPGTNAQLFNAAQAIFTGKCAIPGCHAGGSSQAGLNLSSGNAFSNTVAVRSSELPTLLRVSPGDDIGSYLYQKIIPNGNIAPQTARMPLGCSGNNCLSDTEIKAIQDWINAGAPNAQ